MWAESLNVSGARFGDEGGGNGGGEHAGANDSRRDGFAVPLNVRLRDVTAACAIRSAGDRKCERRAASVSLRRCDESSLYASRGLEGVAVVVAAGEGQE